MSEPLRDTAQGSKPEPADDAERAEPGTTGAGLPPPSAVESIVGALLEAGPDVAEHVVRAAQELLLAAQAIVDAANTAVREQQELRRAGSVGERGTAPEPSEAAAPVRHLDVAE